MTTNILCKIDGCERKILIVSQQLCSPHYQKARRKVKDPARMYTRVPFNEEGLRECVDCKTMHPSSEFTRHHSKTGRNTTRRVCRVCAVLRLRCARMGITIAEFWSLLERQQHRCAICPTHISEKGKSFSIDHDHSCCPGKTSCGKCVRGLLCTQCNSGLGMFKDNPQVLYNAIHYLQNGILRYDNKHK